MPGFWFMSLASALRAKVRDCVVFGGDSVGARAVQERRTTGDDAPRRLEKSAQHSQPPSRSKLFMWRAVPSLIAPLRGRRASRTAELAPVESVVAMSLPPPFPSGTDFASAKSCSGKTGDLRFVGPRRSPQVARRTGLVWARRPQELGEGGTAAGRVTSYRRASRRRTRSAPLRSASERRPSREARGVPGKKERRPLLLSARLHACVQQGGLRLS